MADIPEISGPSQPPASGEAPRRLVIMLHGFGANGADLIGLAPYFAQVLPDAEFLSPDAPYPCELGPFGFQWFNIMTQDPHERIKQLRNAQAIVNRFVDTNLAQRGLTDADLALVGFSQGTMISLFTGLRRAHPCASIVGYSGRLEAPELLEEEITVRPPVLLIHGDQDQMLPVSLIEEAATTLKRNNVPVEHHVRPGLGHSIDGEGIQLAQTFLVRGFTA